MDRLRPLRHALAVAALAAAASAFAAAEPAGGPPDAAATPAERAAPRPSPRPAARPATPSDPVEAAAARVAELEHEEHSFLRRHLPTPLLEAGPRGLRWWQWLALPLALLIAWALGWLLGWVTRRLLGHLAARTTTTWDDLLIERLGPPITLLWSLLVASALRPVLELDGAFDALVARLLRAGFFYAIFWGAFRAIDVAFGMLGETPAARANAGLRGLVPLLRKVAKVAALAIGLVAVLTELGFQVTSLLAGLGIGGLAIALAAQKTVENLIGSLAIGVDQPFRVGDLVMVDGVLGTVEVIGMRSTRLRTLDRTLVTLPNGKLADMRIESYAPRDRYRLSVTLGLSYATTSAQMRQVLRAIEAELRAHPSRGPDEPVVRFANLTDSSLSVEVMAWLVAPDYGAFSALRGELYLRFMEIVEAAGADFAFPTQTVHVASLPAGAAPKG